MDLEHLAKVDKLKTKMLKYIFYKKRTEREVREKFKNEDSDLVEETIENLIELGYINDEKYVEKYFHEVVALKNLSIFEIKYKLLAKGVSESIIDDYISKNDEMLSDYEALSANNLIRKRKDTYTKEETMAYLNKKGYPYELIRKLDFSEYEESDE